VVRQFVSQRTSVPLLCLAVLAMTASPCAAKPTREQVVAFAERCKKEEPRMDLIAEFGVDFSGIDFSGVDFRGCHTVGYETNLRNANFAHCNLQRTEFGAAILDDADFTGANLDRATYVTASLRRAKLLNVSLRGTQFYQTDLSGAQLTGADLSSANITGSHFRGADLSAAILSGAKNDYWWNDFGNANLTRANFSGLKLNGARFENAILRSADLSGTQLVQADFTGADLTEASFNNANVESALFRSVQGLNHAQRNRLEQQAQRWQCELKTSIVELLNVLYFPTYALVIVALVGLSFRTLRLPDRHRLTVIAAAVNVMAIVPAGLLYWMKRSGVSPIVQFNVGSSAAMELWSAWVGLYPLIMLALLGCLGVAVGAALVFLASHWRLTDLRKGALGLVYIVLTIVHCLFVTHWVGSNFPSV
jgi:uncharacterized protein YjbI with pentapeptide repeats